MKPIQYFSLFEEAKNEFTIAFKKGDFRGKMEAAKKLMAMSHQIVHKNYHIGMRKLFIEQAKNHNNAEAREMFNIWSELVDMSLEGLSVAAAYHDKFSVDIIAAVDFLNVASEKISSEDEKVKSLADECLSEMKKEYKPYLRGIECITNAMMVPLSHFVNIVTSFAKDSYFLKEEEIMISGN